MKVVIWSKLSKDGQITGRGVIIRNIMFSEAKMTLSSFQELVEYLDVLYDHIPR